MVDLPADGKGLGWIVSHDPCRLLLIPGLQPASITAAAAGDQQALAYLRFTAQHYAAHPKACSLSPLDKVCLEFTKHGSRDINEFEAELQESNPRVYNIFRARETFTRELLEGAARTGQLAAMKWIRAICPRTSYSESSELASLAVAHGHLEVLKYICSGPTAYLQDLEYLSAGAADHLECIKWLFSQGMPQECSLDGCVLTGIARDHGLSRLQWLYENCDIAEEFADPDLLVVAVEKGDQPLLVWLRALNPPVPWSISVCLAAAKCGNISMLAWLRGQEPPCPWDERVTSSAAAQGHLAMLQWLRTQQPPCPWGTNTCRAAARCGRLTILRWLRGQVPPCPWDAACYALSKSQQLAVPQWLHAHGCPFDEQTALTAARWRNLQMLQWLHSVGCPLHPQCLGIAVCHGNLAMLEWLCEQGCSLTGGLYIAAAEAKQSHMLKYLYSKRVPVSGPSCSRMAPGIFLPHLLFLTDIGIQLPQPDKQRVAQARKAHCTFHGLVRWCRLAVSDPSRGAFHAFDSLAEDTSGQVLLSRLCMLPQELLNKIAIAAELQHDICSP